MLIGKKKVYVDMDGVLADYEKHAIELGYTFKEASKVEGFFSELEPMKGAIDAYRWLNEHFDTYILTGADWDNSHSYMEKVEWVKRFLPEATKRVILSDNKQLLIGDYLIDDREVKGAKDFTGEWIQFGKEPFENWDKVIQYLTKKEYILSQKEIEDTELYFWFSYHWKNDNIPAYRQYFEDWYKNLSEVQKDYFKIQMKHEKNGTFKDLKSKGNVKEKEERNISI